MDSKGVQASNNVEFQQFLAFANLPQVKYLHVDTESNGQPLKDGRGHAIGLSIDICYDGTNAFSYYFPFRHRTEGNLDFSYRDKLKELIESKPTIAQNTRFDILSLKTLGIEMGFDFEDTMLLAHNVDENLFGYGLDQLAKGLGYDGKAKEKHFDKAVQLFGWDGLPVDFMGDYAAVDASLLRPIFNHYKPIYDAEDDSNGELWDYDKKFMLLLNDIEGIGARVDLNLAEQEIERGEKRMQELTNDIGLNPGSTTQLQELLFEHLGIPVNDAFRSKKTGKPSLDKRAMEYYETQLELLGSPVAQQVLEYRGYQKAVSSYWKAYVTHVSPDGRIRPNFNLHRTLTNRLSCDTPNLQQIPRITAKPWNRLVKAGFIPEDGYEIWEADYSQLEMRLTAAYSKDQVLIDIFDDDTRDLFTEMSIAMGLPRDPIKTGVYATGYGAGLDKLASVFGNMQMAIQFKNEYRTNYPGIQKVTNMATAAAKGQGFIRYWSKRRRHFGNLEKEAHKAFNSVIQGGAADIVKRVMIRLHENVHDIEECRMILQVHDSVWFEIRKDKVDHYRKEITNTMQDVQPDFGVRFKIDFHKLGG